MWFMFKTKVCSSCFKPRYVVHVLNQGMWSMLYTNIVVHVINQGMWFMCKNKVCGQCSKPSYVVHVINQCMCSMVINQGMWSMCKAKTRYVINVLTKLCGPCSKLRYVALMVQFVCECDSMHNISPCYKINSNLRFFRIRYKKLPWKITCYFKYRSIFEFILE